MTNVRYDQTPAHDKTVLPAETPLYRYLSATAFISLLVNKELGFTRISSWDDVHEARRFHAMKMKDNYPYATQCLDDFYVACWSLQSEDRLLFGEDVNAYQRSVDELAKEGSDAMWRAYCSGGGVRIKTTLGKLEELFQASSLPTSNLHSGRVYYDPDDSNWSMTLGSVDSISPFLQKRVCFRSEAEFRFVFCAREGKYGTHIKVSIENVYEFIDEILVSPATLSDQWKSRALFKAAQGNARDCRISQLYGSVSEER